MAFVVGLGLTRRGPHLHDDVEVGASTAQDRERAQDVGALGPVNRHLGLGGEDDAVRARATVGEISGALAENWGYFRPSL